MLYPEKFPIFRPERDGERIRSCVGRIPCSLKVFPNFSWHVLFISIQADNNETYARINYPIIRLKSVLNITRHLGKKLEKILSLYYHSHNNNLNNTQLNLKS